MKKIATILLAVLLFCSCGVTCRECVTDPYKIYVKETSGTNAVFLVEMDSDIELELRKIIIQRFEDDRWVVLESLKEYISPEELEFPKKGKTAEWNIEFEDVYGELPTGKYRALFHGNRYDADKKYSWYYKAEFSIDNPNYEKAGPKTLDITAESHGWNRACGIKVFNNSDREILLSAMWELYFETDGKFEKLDYIRGIGYDKTMLSIAPGESYDLSDNTEGAYGLLPVGKYRIDCRIVFDNDAGFENEQTVSGEFEITGLEKESTSFIWDKTAELSGTEITVTFRNDKGNEIRYGEDYFIQKLEGEDWITVEPSETPAFDTVLYTLDEIGDKFVEWSADLSLIYGELPKGSYRLVKTFFTDADNYINGKHYAFFEFEVE